MIHNALDFLAKELNAHLELKNGIVGEKIVLTNVAKEDGAWAIPNNRLGLSLINIEEEKVFKEQKTAFINDAGQTEHHNPEIKLNLYVLVTANYTSGDVDGENIEYLEGLKQLSYVISFFQDKYVFTNNNTPLMASIDPNIQKLIVELFSYSFEQLYNFWTVIGAKYLPSVLYKVRLLTFQGKRLQAQRTALEGIDLKS
ncbi:MAG: DUF4255 domain-containing protein [Bacteroidota bacterium]